MKIGIVREIKNMEGRVAMTPQGVKAILESSPGKHEVYVQAGAGEQSGYKDEEYEKAGAIILPTAEEVYKRSRLIVHVKEPLPEEYDYLKEDHILFTYLHLAAAPDLTKKLMEIGLIAFAYETLELENGRLPLLEPMSKIAGKMAFVYSLFYQQENKGGRGIYLGEIDGKKHSRVLIIGGGTVGTNAAESLIAIGAKTVILEKKPERREYLKKKYPNAEIKPDTALDEELPKADVVIGAVLIHGAKAPKLITREQIKTMKKGAVIVDISIDQGGITEVSRPTSIENPSYIVDDVVICAVPNIPGTVPRTSTKLLVEATLPYVLKIANEELNVLKYYEFRKALNIYKGKCTEKPVAEAAGVPYTPVEEILKELKI